MNLSYLLYQGEHSKSATEQREADIAIGQLAAALGRRRPTRRRRPAWRGRAGQQPTLQIPRQARPCHDLAARM
jgi:hypothetical protein